MDPVLPVALPVIPGTASGARGPAQTDPDAGMRQVAQEFEAAFLAEMLKYTGINKTSEEFGGGAGEDAFGSLLTQEYANLLAARGGIGLAEQIFEALKQRTPEE